MHLSELVRLMLFVILGAVMLSLLSSVASTEDDGNQTRIERTCRETLIF